MVDKADLIIAVFDASRESIWWRLSDYRYN